MRIKQLILLLSVLVTVTGCTATKNNVSVNVPPNPLSLENITSSAQKMSDISGQLKKRITKVIDVRNGISYLPNENKPFTGKYETYYPNGQKAMVSYFKNGKINNKGFVILPE